MKARADFLWNKRGHTTKMVLETSFRTRYRGDLSVIDLVEVPQYKISLSRYLSKIRQHLCMQDLVGIYIAFPSKISPERPSVQHRRHRTKYR